MFQKAGARRIVLVTGRTAPAPESGVASPPPSGPPWTMPGAEAPSGPSPPTTNPWIPCLSGRTPVATVVQSDGEAEGSIERRMPVVPSRSRRAKLGNRPFLTSGRITPQSAPSRPTITIRGRPAPGGAFDSAGALELAGPFEAVGV